MRKKYWLVSFSLIITLLSCMTFSTIPTIREFQKTVELKGKSTIFFDNLHGDLEIFGWKKDSIDIRAEKIGTDSQLRQTNIDIKKGRNTLSIRTLYPRADIKSVFVDFELRVPENIIFKEIRIEKGNLKSFQIYGELFVSIEEGDIEIEDFSGSCNLFTDKGTITARIFEINPGDDLTFRTTDGDIRLYLPSDLNVQIKAETRLGEIISDFAPEETREKALKKWEETFGKGEAKIQIKSWEGDIHLKKIQ